MDNVKNNFEELRKLLSGALAILEETSITLSNRVLELEKRVEELENRVPVDEEIAAVGERPIREEVAEEILVKDVIAEEVQKKEFDEDTAAEEVVSVATDEDETVEEPIVEETIVEESIKNTIAEEARDVEVIADATIVGNVIAGDTGEIVEDVGVDCMSAEITGSMDADFADGTDGGLVQESGADLNSVFEESNGVQIVNEAAKPDWYDWEVDYPASYVDDVYKGISFNDRYEFIKELFNVSGSLDEAEHLFKETLDEINEMENFKKVVAYVRERFPQWDEQSDEVYRFYMAVRRKFNR